MDKSYVIPVIPVLTELRELRAKIHEFTVWSTFIKLREDDCKFILSRAIELIECLDGELDENCEHFRALAISRNNELKQEREKSTQLEQRIKVLTAERDLAKKLAKQKAEELNIQLNEKYGTVVDCMELKDKLDKKCREVGELTKELEQEHEMSTQLEQRCSKLVIDRDRAVEYWTKHCEELLQKHREELAAKDREIYEGKLERDKNSDSVTYWRNLAKTLALYGIHATKETYEYYLKVCKNEYIDTDIAHMYPKTTLNDPANFCGNCRHYAQMGKDDGDFEGICTQHYIKRADPDDASCKHFKPTYDTRVVIAKPEFPCCDHCNREDCDNCTLCPF